MQFLFTLSINKYKILAIFWNVFLAIVPCLVVYYLAKNVKQKKWRAFKGGEKIAFILIFLFWLFLLPNTAYLFTIVRHLVNYCFHINKNRVCTEGTTWIVMFFFTYALVGLPTFYYALKRMSLVFMSVFNKSTSSILPIIVIPLTAIGIMFGLFERFNSWDILTHPLIILKTLVYYFANTDLFINFSVITICLYLVYYGLDYFIFKLLKNDKG